MNTTEEYLSIARQCVVKSGCPKYLQDEGIGAAMAGIAEAERTWDPERSGGNLVPSRGWLFYIATNRVKDMVRRWTHYNRLQEAAPKVIGLDEDSPIIDGEHIEAQHEDATERWAIDDMLDHLVATDVLKHALERMNDRQVAVCRHVIIDGMTRYQASLLLGVTESRVSQIYSDVIRRLRLSARIQGVL